MKSNDPIIIDGEEYRRLLSQIADRDIEIAARQARIGRVEHQHKAQLAARDRTIERLKELVEKAWIEGDDSAAGLGYGHGDFNESDAKKQLDSILGPTAPAAAPQR